MYYTNNLLQHTALLFLVHTTSWFRLGQILFCTDFPYLNKWCTENKSIGGYNQILIFWLLVDHETEYILFSIFSLLSNMEVPCPASQDVFILFMNNNLALSLTFTKPLKTVITLLLPIPRFTRRLLV